MLRLINFIVLFTLMLSFSQKIQASVYQSGMASYYGSAHHGKRTASGVRFNMHHLTAAHRTLPFGTRLLVSCNETGKTVTVTVNDRGPYHGNRILDLSQAAAKHLGIIKKGTARIEIEKIENLDRIEGLIQELNID